MWRLDLRESVTMDDDVAIWVKLEHDEDRHPPKLLEAFICECPIEDFSTIYDSECNETAVEGCNQTDLITVVNLRWVRVWNIEYPTVCNKSWLGCCKLENEILKEAKNREK